LSPEPTDPTEGQLVAYNARDVDAFVPWFTEDVIVEDAMGARIVTGHDELRARYGPMFAKYPALHAAILSRIRVGEFVLHEESVTGRQPEPEHVVAIYRVRGGLIDHVRFIR
jgi:hypothetical protein